MRFLLVLAFLFMSQVAPAQSMERAQSLYARVHKAGLVKSTVVFRENTDAEYEHTPGYVVPDWENGKCTFFVDEKAIRDHGFSDDFSFRFMVYHELAHCDLYAFPQEIRIDGVKAQWQKMAQDIIALEYLHKSSSRVNAYNTYHEIFADSMAICMLMKHDNESPEKLREILNYRKSNSMSHMDNHDSAQAIEQLLEKGGCDGNGLMKNAATIANTHIATAFFKKVFKADIGQIDIPSLLEGTVRTALSQESLWALPEEKAFIRRRLAEINGRGWPVWTDYAKAHAPENSDKTLKDFIKARQYETGP